MVLKKLKEFLDSHNIKYTVLSHSQAFTAQEIAAVAHVPSKELAKAVIVKFDGKMIMVVVPASDMVDFKSLKKLVGATAVRLANEDEFKGLFPECELGAMPPFGNLYNIDVLVADDLAEDQEIAFNAGTHRELVKMAYKDFEHLVQPKIARISVKRNISEEEGWKYDG
jgi:Ala-tRNA(Pro) deacylase